MSHPCLAVNFFFGVINLQDRGQYFYQLSSPRTNGDHCSYGGTQPGWPKGHFSYRGNQLAVSPGIVACMGPLDLHDLGCY
jgi:hypothetical protein